MSSQQSRRLAQQIAQRVATKARSLALSLFVDSVDYYEQEAQDVISAPGLFPAESGDIIWTGALKASQKTTRQRGKATIQWAPKAPKSGYGYAPRVVQGFRAWGNGRQVAPRDFPLLAAQKTQQAGGNIEYSSANVQGDKAVARLRMRDLRVSAHVRAK